MAQDNTPTLLGLPLEARVKIYHELIGPRVYWYTAYHDPAEERKTNGLAPPRGKINKYRAGFLGKFPIMRVNKQINKEVTYTLQVTALRIRPSLAIGEFASASIHDRIGIWKGTILNVNVHLDSREITAIGMQEKSYQNFHAGLSKLVRNLPNIQTLTVTCGNCESLCEDLCQLLGEDLLKLCVDCPNLVKHDRGGKWHSTFFRVERDDKTVAPGDITIVRQNNGVYKQSNGVKLPGWPGKQRGPRHWFRRPRVRKN